uniref:YqaJ viral recombinase domain-containing protein n=1 Tax=Anopheles farauti TaxID=69004 RepID=A0A182Q674_9DIPT
MDVKMEILLKIPKLDLEMVKLFLEENKFTDSKAIKLLRSRNSSTKHLFENITVLSLKLDQEKLNGKQALTVDAKEELNKRTKGKKLPEKHHVIVVEFTGGQQHIHTVNCTACTKGLEQCGAVTSVICWIQHNQQEALKKDEENLPQEGNAPKKIMLQRECRIVLTPLDIQKLMIHPPSPPVLKKVKKLVGPFSSTQMEKARELSMINLIREFKGTDAQEFLKFCTNRMSDTVCATIPLLTIEQAETDLWHELRVARITASRIREAARCTMLSGSLVNKIMGMSSNFSLAMKRGTDLEGHVLAELQKEYPGLRDTGLILDAQHPWLGASPDGICDEFVLEIKCPYTENTHKNYVNISSLSPKYFAQIQLQMHITQHKKALLAVAALDFETTKHITKVWIDYDQKYVDEVLRDAFEFWRKAIFKSLLRKRSSKK